MHPYRPNSYAYQVLEAYSDPHPQGLAYRDAYGHGPKRPRCATCGEVDVERLYLVEINDDGSYKHLINDFTKGFAKQVKRLGYPPKYKTFCYKCGMRACGKDEFGKEVGTDV